MKLEELNEKTKARKIKSVAKLLKCCYVGHLVRDSNEKWSHIMTSWVPHVWSCGRGRPTTKWSDELIKNFGASWAREVRDRTSWRGLVEAYAHKRGVEGGTSDGGGSLTE